MPDSSENNVACRICMDPKDEYVSLFISDLSKKVMEIADVRVEKHDGLPENVCVQCEKDLEKCYEFRLKVQVADKKFRQNLKFSQVDIEECKIKEERYVIDDDSDNGDDKHSESMDEENYDEPDVPQRINEETEVPVPDPLNHVVVIEEEEKKVEMSENPASYDDSKAEEEKVDLQKMEEVSVNPLDSMKEETETEMMDIDGNQPDAFGPSSSVGSSELPNPFCFVSSELFSRDHSEMSRFQMKAGQQPLETRKLTPVPPVINWQEHEAQNQAFAGDPLQNGEFMWIPQTSYNLNGGVLIHCVKAKAPQNIAFPKSYTQTPSNTPTIISSSGVDVQRVTTATSNVTSSCTESRASNSVNSVTCISSDSCVDNANVSHSRLPTDGNHEPEGFCSVCSVDCGTTELLNEHKTDNEFICRVCLHSFKNHNELENHFFKHKKYTCVNCKKYYFSRADLLHHKKTELSCNDPRKFRCQFCKNRFVHRMNLDTHLLQKHPDNEHKWYPCIVCDKGFKTLSDYNKHMKQIHTVSVSVECDICHRIQPGPEHLKTHIKNTHLHTPHSCPICSKVFANKYSYETHLDLHNGEEKTCEICQAVLKGKWAFKNHVKIHERTFTCTFCREVFEKRHLRDRHCRTIHGMKKSKPVTLMCEVCGKSILGAMVLKQHMATHSDDKPFVCEVCGAAFKAKVSLRTHSRIHSDVKKYSCKHCGKGFRWKQTFDKHVLKCESTENTSSEDDNE